MQKNDNRAKAKAKIDALDKKISTLRARKAAEEAKLRRQAKKDDTRRKILIGARQIYEAEQNGGVEKLYQSMDSFLTRNSDRELFGLAPLDETLR